MGQTIYSNADQFHQAVVTLAHDLDALGIKYAIIGGYAIRMYNYLRYTEDIDILLTAEGLQLFENTLVGRGYIKVPGTQHNFLILIHNKRVRLEVILAGQQEGAITFPAPNKNIIEKRNGICYINLKTLLRFKLKSDRIKDQQDAGELIRINQLSRSYCNFIEYTNMWDMVNKGKRYGSK